MFPGPSIPPHPPPTESTTCSSNFTAHPISSLKRQNTTYTMSSDSYIVTNSSTYHIAAALTPHADAADCNKVLASTQPSWIMLVKSWSTPLIKSSMVCSVLGLQIYKWRKWSLTKRGDILKIHNPSQLSLRDLPILQRLVFGFSKATAEDWFPFMPPTLWEKEPSPHLLVSEFIPPLQNPKGTVSCRVYIRG